MTSASSQSSKTSLHPARNMYPVLLIFDAVSTPPCTVTIFLELETIRLREQHFHTESNINYHPAHRLRTTPSSNDLEDTHEPAKP